MVLFLEEDSFPQALVERRLWGDNQVGAGWSKPGEGLGVISVGAAEGIGVGEEDGDGTGNGGGEVGSPHGRDGLEAPGDGRMWAFGLRWTSE